ncbi:MAG TPA: hypothetical protein VGB30_07745 [bacterium]|jgi:hypothetical protein
MKTRNCYLIPLAIISAILIFPATSVAETENFSFIDIHATNQGMTAQIGRFQPDETIDILYLFENNSDNSVAATFTYDVKSEGYGKVTSDSVDATIHPGVNSYRLSFIPDRSYRVQTYAIYASLTIDGTKFDREFEIKIEASEGVPGIYIDDVRLVPLDEDAPEELRGAAIPYRIEIDFNLDYIIDFGYAELRWIGVTSQDFVLDQGIGTTSTEDGMNTFEVESYIARPPSDSPHEAVFSVYLTILGYTDSVTFPLETLPVSLKELRAPHAAGAVGYDFTIGEAYMVTADGARSSVFNVNEPIYARLHTGGIVPGATRVIIQVRDQHSDDKWDYFEDYVGGIEMPMITMQLPYDFDLSPGIYTIQWSILANHVLLADRMSSFTVSEIYGNQIPETVNLPGSAVLRIPISWDNAVDGERGAYATLISDRGIVCTLKGQEMDEPINVSLMADIYESGPGNSRIQADAVPLTEDESESEGVWEYLRRAWLSDGKVFVNDYWLYGIGDGQYQFLISTCTGDESKLQDVYSAADQITMSLTIQ